MTKQTRRDRRRAPSSRHASGAAPSAKRIPNSRKRSAAVYDTTLYTPMTPRSSAAAPATAISSMVRRTRAVASSTTEPSARMLAAGTRRSSSPTTRHRTRPSFGADTRRQLEEHEEVAQIQALLVHLRQGKQDSPDQVSALAERRSQEREHADRERASRAAISGDR